MSSPMLHSTYYMSTRTGTTGIQEATQETKLCSGFRGASRHQGKTNKYSPFPGCHRFPISLSISAIFTGPGCGGRYLFEVTLQFSHFHLPGCLVQGILLLEPLALTLLIPQLRAEVIQQTLQSVQELPIFTCLP